VLPGMLKRGLSFYAAAQPSRLIADRALMKLPLGKRLARHSRAGCVRLAGSVMGPWSRRYS